MPNIIIILLLLVAVAPSAAWSPRKPAGSFKERAVPIRESAGSQKEQTHAIDERDHAVSNQHRFTSVPSLAISKEHRGEPDVLHAWHVERQSRNPRMTRNYAPPHYESECGSYSIAFVIDTSGSMFLPIFGGNPDNIGIIKHALIETLHYLEYKPVKVAVYSFGTHAHCVSEGYWDMQDPGSLPHLKDKIGYDNHTGFTFSDNEEDILTNWDDALYKVRHDAEHEYHNKVPTYIVFITDGDPTTHNMHYGVDVEHPYDAMETDVSAALEQVYHLLHDYAFETYNGGKHRKIIPVGLGHYATESHLRALTGLETPELGQDYYLLDSYSDLHTVLGHIAHSDTCCAHHRDTCGVCFGDDTTCYEKPFKVWCTAYQYASGQQNHGHTNKHSYGYKDDYLRNGERIHMKMHWDTESPHYHYEDGHYKVVIDKIILCVARHGEMVPYDDASPHTTGCRTVGAQVDACVLYDAHTYTKGGRCWPVTSTYGHYATGSGHHGAGSYDAVEPWHGSGDIDFDAVFAFQWDNYATGSAFSFRARPISHYCQLVHIHWKMEYAEPSDDYGGGDSHGGGDYYHSNGNDNDDSDDNDYAIYRRRGGDVGITANYRFMDDLRNKVQGDNNLLDAITLRRQHLFLEHGSRGDTKTALGDTKTALGDTKTPLGDTYDPDVAVDTYDRSITVDNRGRGTDSHSLASPKRSVQHTDDYRHSNHHYGTVYQLIKVYCDRYDSVFDIEHLECVSEPQIHHRPPLREFDSGLWFSATVLIFCCVAVCLVLLCFGDGGYTPTWYRDSYLYDSDVPPADYVYGEVPSSTEIAGVAPLGETTPGSLSSPSGITTLRASAAAPLAYREMPAAVPLASRNMPAAVDMTPAISGDVLSDDEEEMTLNLVGDNVQTYRTEARFRLPRGKTIKILEDDPDPDEANDDTWKNKRLYFLSDTERKQD